MTTEDEDLAAVMRLHRGMARQGPGTAEDVRWALEALGVSGEARVLDAGAGPGAVTETLAEALPEARIEAVDASPALVAEARARLARFGPRVTVREGDMARVEGPYDLIWCAGALYFLGVTEGLRAWRGALAPGGTVAFSEPVYLTDPPSEAARAFWAGYPAITGLSGLEARVRAAGYAVEAVRHLGPEAWRGYMDALEGRIDELEASGERPDDPALAAAMAEARAEVAAWRAAPEDIGYALVLARPA